MATNLSQLQAGDLLIVSNHVVIWLGAGTGSTPEVAHASPDTGICLATWDSDDVALPDILSRYPEDVLAFRCERLRLTAALYARTWAEKRGPYGNKAGVSNRTAGELTRFVQRGFLGGFKGFSTRYQAVDHEQNRVVPFNFDACYRAVKWTSRTNRPLSLRQGHRCDTFAAACYQAAALWNATPADNRTKFDQVADQLKAARAPKSTFRLSAGATSVPDGWKSEHAPGSAQDRRFYVRNAYRETVNAGPSRLVPELNSDHGAWQLVCKELLGNTTVTPDDVFTQALAVDALFTSYTVLKGRCASTGSGWTPLHPLHDDLSPSPTAAAATTHQAGP